MGELIKELIVPELITEQTEEAREQHRPPFIMPRRPWRSRRSEERIRWLQIPLKYLHSPEWGRPRDGICASQKDVQHTDRDFDYRPIVRPHNRRVPGWRPPSTSSSGNSVSIVLPRRTKLNEQEYVWNVLHLFRLS